MNATPTTTKTGVLLQISDGIDIPENFIGMGASEEIDHDHRELPWPLDDNSVLVLRAIRVAEHVQPYMFIDWMNEAWRVMHPGGQLVIITPYGGSPPWWADPLSCNGLTEETPLFFDPEHKSQLWERYKPRPWRIEKGGTTWHREGNLQIALRKRSEQ